MMEFKAVCAFPFRELKAPESCVGKQRPANFGAMFWVASGRELCNYW